MLRLRILSLLILATPVDASTFESNLLTHTRELGYYLTLNPPLDECTATLKSFAIKVRNIDSTIIAQTAAQNPNWRTEIYHALSDTRLALFERLQSYHTARRLSDTDISAFRMANRSLRGLAEESRHLPGSHAEELKETNIAVFINNNFIFNKKFFSDFRISRSGEVDLSKGIRSGDIFVVRGSSEISSTIARIPYGEDADGQASHLFIVYKDESDHFWALESLIEDGLKVRPFDFFKKPHARYSVFRMKDSQVAHAGAKKLFQAIKDTQNAGHEIRYNFSMKPFNPELAPIPGGLYEAYCSQSSYFQALWGSNNSLCVPSYPSLVMMKNSWLLDQLKIVNGALVYAPGDAEMEPQFDFVFEQSDPLMAHDALLSDAIISTLMRYMEDGYVILPDWRSQVVTRFALPLRKRAENWPKWIPGIKKFKSLFPWYIEKTQIQFMVSLNTVFKEIKKSLKEREALHLSHTKRPLNWIELCQVVENILQSNQLVQRYFVRNQP